MRLNKTIHVLGVYLLLWLIVLVIIPIFVFQSTISSSFLRSMFYISSAGGLGGIVYLIRGFYKHIFKKNFRTDVFWWYIFRPFLSIIMGTMSYFLIVGGLLSVGNISSLDYEKSILFYSGISFLAGFSFTQFSDKLEELAKTLFAKSGEKK